MKFFCVLLALVACSFAISHTPTHPPRPALDKNIINAVNSAESTWTAGENKYFEKRSVEDVKKLLGWKPNGKKIGNTVTAVAKDIPTSFDSTTAWPKCVTIGTIYDQAECGSCWAFGCVEAVSDRFCIASNGAINYVLSFQDMVSCGPDDGCEGGDADDAWGYAQQTGLVTGTCYPYNIPTCAPQDEPCLNFVATPACQSTCNDTENWQQSLHFLSNTYDVDSGVSAMQTEIMTNGPVEVCFTVYSDFVTYKSGVYQYQTGDALGGHCVKMIGWGVENGTPYWLCNNSWTTYWGDNGQFKILRGADECGIEDDVVAGTPQV